MFATLAWHITRAARLQAVPGFQYALSRLDPAACRQILTLGLPLGGLALMEGGLFAVTAILMGVLGAEALAANQIVITVIAVNLRSGDGAGRGGGDPRRLRHRAPAIRPRPSVPACSVSLSAS